MSWKAWLGAKLLLRQQEGRSLSSLTLTAVAGIILGVLALVVVSSVMNGFERAVQQSVTALQGDVLVFTRGQPFEDSPSLVETIKKNTPELVAWTPSFASELMLSGPSGVAGSLLEGLDLTSLAKATGLADHMIEGRMPERAGEIVLAENLSERLGVKMGERVRLIFPSVAGNPRVEVATCVGRVRLGMFQYDSKYAFAQIDQVREWAGVHEPLWTSIRLKLSPSAVPRDVAERLQAQFAYPVRVRDWTLLNRNLAYAIALEKALLLLLMGLVVLVATFNMVSALMILLFEKKVQFSILRVFGAARKDLILLTLLLGGILGVLGAGLGILSGLCLNKILEVSRLFELSREIYQVGQFRFEARWVELVGVFIGAVALAAAAAWIPARSLKKKNVIEGLRGD